MREEGEAIELQDMDEEEEDISIIVDDAEDDPVQASNGEDELNRLNVKHQRRGSTAFEIANDTILSSPTEALGVGKSLHQLARDGDADAMASLLLASSRDEVAKYINTLDEKRLSPLHYAARHSDLEVMKLLVQFGADVNIKGDDDMTPIHYAARYARVNIPKRKRKMSITPITTPKSSEGDPAHDLVDNKEVIDMLTIVKAAEDMVDATVDYLISNGANINAHDKYGMTPLHHTAIRGNRKVLTKLLLAPGINKEPKDMQNSTPLHLAATYNQPGVAKILLNQGGNNPRATDRDHRTPLHEACQEGSHRVAEILLKDVEEKLGTFEARNMTHDKDFEGDTPLSLGVGKGGTQIVQLLLSYKANPNQKNKELTFPIHFAARTGDLDTLKLLVQNGAMKNSMNAIHQTPLYLAAENNNLSVMEYLLDSNADIDKWTVNQVTPLCIAAIEGHAEAVNLLMSRGAKLELCDKDDRSPLFHAAQNNNIEVIQAILTYPDGKDLLEMADMYDNLPIHAAAREGHLEALKALAESGSPIDRKNEDEQTPIHLAAINGRVDVVEELLMRDRNAIMNEDEDSNKPLHLACLNKKHKTAEVLLKYGADVNCRNAKKWTPLDVAASVGAYHCAKLLLDTHSPIDPVDRTKTTPLHLAAENGHAKVLELLLNYGADITMEDSHHRNALERAILSGKKNCAKAILEHKHWKKAMRTSHPTYDDHGTLVPETPLRLLIKRYPDLAELVFNKCISRKAPVGSDDPLITPKSIVVMNYEFIDDAFCINAISGQAHKDKFFKYCAIGEDDEVKMFNKTYNTNSKVVMDNHPLMIMANERQRNLLKHPLCVSLVRRKWMKYGRYLYYLSLSAYALFLTFLTIFALSTPNAQQENGKEFCEKADDAPDERFPALSIKKTSLLLVSQYGILIMATINCLVELLQFIRSGRRYLQWSNLFDWIVYLLAIFMVIDIAQGSDLNGRRTCWQWEMVAVNLTLAWLNLLGDVRELPFLGIYVIMFFDILKTFLRFGIVFLIFIIAFGLGFNLLLNNQTPFDSVGKSLLKTSVMMIGEFEYEGIFHDDENAPEFPNLTYAFFVAFLIIMSIIIVNLLIGLAVDDIKAVQEQAILKRLAMQVELVLDVERLIPDYFLRRMFITVDEIRPMKAQWWKVFKDIFSKSSIIKDVTERSDNRQTNDGLIVALESLQESVRGLRAELKLVAEENKENSRMLAAITDKNRIYMDDFDENISL